MKKKINSISSLGFGTLTLGPYQKNFPIDRGADLIVHAIKRGINVIDTADLYMTYPYIKSALKKIDPDMRENLVIMSRSYDYTYEGMAKGFNKACVEMGVERIPVFMLHEMESELTLKGHAPALKYLVEMKTQGKIDLVGISTHYIRAVRAAADHPDIDCIFAILNRRGLGIMDGDAQEMESALSQAHDKGKIIFIMKAIGGGHLFREAEESLAYVSALPFVDSVIVGMQSVEEIECNIEIMENGERMSEDGSIFSPQRPQRPQRVLDDIRVSKNLKNSIFPFSHYPFPFSLFPLPIHPRGHKRIKEKRNWIKDPLSLFHLPYSYFPLPSGGIPVFSIAILRELCDLCGEKPPCSINGSRKSEDVSRFLHKERKLLIEDYCRGCGECEKACPFGAIRVIEGKARVDYDKCMLCSYCAYKCPDFCIKVI